MVDVPIAEVARPDCSPSPNTTGLKRSLAANVVTSATASVLAANVVTPVLTDVPAERIEVSYKKPKTREEIQAQSLAAGALKKS